MRGLKSCLIAMLSVALASSTAMAQQAHVVGAVALERIIADKVSQRSEERRVGKECRL